MDQPGQIVLGAASHLRIVIMREPPQISDRRARPRGAIARARQVGVEKIEVHPDRDVWITRGGRPEPEHGHDGEHAHDPNPHAGSPCHQTDIPSQPADASAPIPRTDHP